MSGGLVQGGPRSGRGAFLPRYHLVRELGAGGIGRVYLVKDRLEEDRLLALKVAQPRVSPEHLEREFRLLREIRHPGIASAFDFGRLPRGGPAYFTMEYVRGVDLGRRAAALRRERGGPARLASLLAQVADVLAYLHSRDLLHLDLKPSNIVVEEEAAHETSTAGAEAALPAPGSGEEEIPGEEGRVRLIDFGLFQSLAFRDLPRARGTLRYMAPELFAGGPIDERTDIYSLGVTLYQACTGRYPVPGATPEEISATLRERPATPSELIPEPLDRVVMKCLARSPERRWRRSSEVAAALREAARELRREPGASPGAATPPCLAAHPEEEPDFAGRRREREVAFEWVAALSRRQEGAPPAERALLLLGEIGSGKTRLLETITTELLVRGIPVVELRSHIGPGGGALRRLVEKAAALEPLRGQRRERFAFLLAQVGLIKPDPRHRREAEVLEVQAIRERIARDARELLGGLFPPGPAVLVLDELHWAEEDLRDLVLSIAGEGQPEAPSEAGAGPGKELRGAILHVVGAARSEPEHLGRIFPQGPPAGARSIHLGPLPAAEAHRALARFIPLLGRGTVEGIVRAGRGRPCLLTRLLHAALRGEPAEALPADLEHLLLRRMEAESGPNRHALHALALLGGRATPEELAAVVGLGPAVLRSARRALSRAGLVREDGGRLLLEHEALRERILAGLPQKERMALHATAGKMLLEDPGRLPEAALHLFQGGLPVEGEAAGRKALEALRAAGRHGEALALAGEALRRLPRGSDRAFWEEAAGDLGERCGQFDRAVERYRALVGSGDLDPEERMRLLRKQGGVLQRMGRSREAEEALREALALEPQASSLEEHLQVLNELAALKLFGKDYAAASTFASRGLELLAGPGEASLGGEARATHALNFHSNAGHIALRQFEYTRSIEELERALSHARKLGTLTNEALILNNLGIAYSQSNALPRALRVYRQAAALARRTGDGSALFSMLCNLSGIRGRLGQVQAARALLAEARAMPHASRSSRARLFLLHCEGLLTRLLGGDARGRWEEAVRLADELPDPLFASYGRIHLLENETAAGRWKEARGVLAELDRLEDADARLARARAVRGALLDALCGRAADSRSRLASAGGEPAGPPSYSDALDSLLQAAALIELGNLEEAEKLLLRQRAVFQESGQPPGGLECALLLADAALRRRNRTGALGWIREARVLVGRHDDPKGSRGAAARLPLLEARAALLSPRRTTVAIADRLADAAGSLPSIAAGELTWLVRLVEEEAGRAPAGAARRARARFLEGLAREDRRPYQERDHRSRLGLGSGESRESEESAPTEAARPESFADLAGRYLGLEELARGPELSRALEILRRVTGAREGALLLAGRSPALQGLPRSRRTAVLSQLRALLEGTPSGERPGSDRPPAMKRRGGRREGGPGSVLRALTRGGRTVGSLLLQGFPGGASPAAVEKFLDLALPLWLARAQGRRSSHATAPLVSAVNGSPRNGSSSRTETVAAARVHFGSSPAMRELEGLVLRTRESHLPVLIIGESGTGKELLARAIHSLSPRGDRPFIAQSCAAIPEGLLEADLFGYKRGAFSGAERSRTGFLFAADGGTLYLDAVESLPGGMQAKLLRFLEGGEVRPLGEEKSRKLDVRTIASSQEDLKAAVERGEFRRDLYYRLAGISLRLPPLRERAEDIPALVERFLRDVPGVAFHFTPQALRVLQSYTWPGNVRELESLVRRLSFAGLREVGAAEVQRSLGAGRAEGRFPRWLFEGKSYDHILAELKREYLLHLHERAGGDLARMARELRISKRNLYLRFASAGIRPRHLRPKPGG